LDRSEAGPRRCVLARLSERVVLLWSALFFVLGIDRDFHDYLVEHFGDASEAMIKIFDIVDWEVFN
jgi:hypothetical protein